ncbi:MAG: hypothetical protein DMF53_18955 [Acidobacteria bacterium]|nr:MAG: hypothetical protein DMF53_18955 [Acidobacteriota bacterium]
MPRSSIADSIAGWEKAVANARANAMDVPGMEAYLAPLEKILADAKDLTARLDMRLGIKQQETRDRRALIQEGSFQVSRIRSAIKAFYGRNSERVIELGARPVRPRTGKVQQAKAKPPAVSPPGTSGPPSPPAAAPNEKDEAPRNPTAG